MDTINPFRVTQYTDEQRATFFGRDRERDQLLNRVIADRIVVVHATSGAGKSSLVQAGLLPLLGTEGIRRSLLVRPSEFDRMSGDARRDGSPTFADRSRAFHEHLLGRFGIPVETPVTGAATFAQAIHRAAAGPLCLVVDQVEEVFTRHAHDWREESWLLRCLGGLSQLTTLWLVLVVRDDFLGRLLEHERLFVNRLESRFCLRPMQRTVAIEVLRATLAHHRSLAGSASTAYEDPGDNTLGELVAAAERLLTSRAGAPSSNEGESGTTADTGAATVLPLFLQIVASYWFANRRGPLQASADNVDALELSAFAAIAFIDQQFEAAVSMPGAAAGGSVPSAEYTQAELRSWCQIHLIEAGYRKPAFVSAPVTGLEGLIERGLVSRRSIPSDSIELTHDGLVQPLERSNARWFDAGRRRLWGRRLRWQKHKEWAQLLGPFDAFLPGRGNRMPLPANDDYVRKSRRKWWEIGAAAVFLVMVGIGLSISLVLLQHKIAENKLLVDEAEQAHRDAHRERQESTVQRTSTYYSRHSWITASAQRDDEYALREALVAVGLSKLARADIGAPERAAAFASIYSRLSADRLITRRRIVETAEVRKKSPDKATRRNVGFMPKSGMLTNCLGYKSAEQGRVKDEEDGKGDCVPLGQGFLKTDPIPVGPGVEIHQYMSLIFQGGGDGPAHEVVCFATAVGKNHHSINLCTRDLSASRDLIPGFGDGRVEKENVLTVNAATVQWLPTELLGATSLQDGFAYAWSIDHKRLLAQIEKSESTDLHGANSTAVRCDQNNCVLVDLLFSERLGSGNVTALWIGRSTDDVIALRAIVDDERFVEVRNGSSMVVHDGNFRANPSFLAMNGTRWLYGLQNVWRSGVGNGSHISWSEQLPYSNRPTSPPFAWRPIIALPTHAPSQTAALVLNDQGEVLLIDPAKSPSVSRARLEVDRPAGAAGLARPVRAIRLAGTGRAVVILSDSSGGDHIAALSLTVDGGALAAVRVDDDAGLTERLRGRCVVDLTSSEDRVGLLLGACGGNRRPQIAGESVVCEYVSENGREHLERCQDVPVSVHGATDARSMSLSSLRGHRIAAFGFRDGHIEVSVAEGSDGDSLWRARGWIPAHVGAVVGLAFVTDHGSDYLRTAGSDGVVLQFAATELTAAGGSEHLPKVPIPVILYRSSRPLQRLWQFDSDTIVASEDSTLIRIPNQNDLLRLACEVTGRDLGEALEWRSQRLTVVGSERRDEIQKNIDAACGPSPRDASGGR